MSDRQKTSGLWNAVFSLVLAAVGVTVFVAGTARLCYEVWKVIWNL